MGQLMHFYAGDPKVIAEALARRDRTLLDNSTEVPLQADFSLHVTSIDLDIMTEVAARQIGAGPTSFEGSWGRRLAGDGNESSVELMASDWVALIAKSDAKALAADWAAALAEEYSDTSLTVTDDMLQGLEALIALCREAVKRKIAMVHAWSL
jgi:hypothetical protein